MRTTSVELKVTHPSCLHATGRQLQFRTQATKKEQEYENSAARQMMGMKGAALETDVNKIRVQLMKPVTWIPLIWGKSVASLLREQP